MLKNTAVSDFKKADSETYSEKCNKINHVFVVLIELTDSTFCK